MQLTIQKISIKKEYRTIAAMMKELQQVEIEMNDKSADWEDIKDNYMNHIIEAQEENDGTCVVAYVGDEAAGFLFGYVEQQDDSRIEINTGDELYISDGFVYPRFRRLGIYQQLNDAIEQHYIGLGIRRILRFTLFTNNRMQNFLQKQGYQPVRLLYEKWIDETGENIVPIKLAPPTK